MTTPGPPLNRSSPAQSSPSAEGAVLHILVAISFCHLLNDLMQSLLPAIYPMLKTDYQLGFTQIGLLTLTYQLTASLLQPAVGWVTDRRPLPLSLPLAMASTLLGLLLLANAPNYRALLLAAALVGVGSSIFHPESSRVARLASGGRYGFAQSFFQVGGNLGASLGPLVAAFIVLPAGQASIAWFGLAALLGMAVLSGVGRWYGEKVIRGRGARASPAGHRALAPRVVRRALAVLLVLMFSKFFYLASLTSYYTFYLVSHFGVSVQAAQMHLFLFLVAAALGTFLGGPLSDRIGRRAVIWASILGVLPFTLLLPHANLVGTDVLVVLIGLILASAFSSILVYAQELLPGRVGTVSGMFFGLAFGMGGLGAAALGVLADRTSIETVYQLCAFLPALGIFTLALPDTATAARPPLTWPAARPAD